MCVLTRPLWANGSRYRSSLARSQLAVDVVKRHQSLPHAEDVGEPHGIEPRDALDRVAHGLHFARIIARDFFVFLLGYFVSAQEERTVDADDVGGPSGAPLVEPI